MLTLQLFSVIFFPFENPNMRLKVFSGLPPVVLNAKVVYQENIDVKAYFNWLKYQGGATWVDQEVEDGEEPVLLDQDQGGADCLQEPVDHVESHRDQIPCPPCFQSWDAKSRGPSVLVTHKPREWSENENAMFSTLKPQGWFQ